MVPGAKAALVLQAGLGGELFFLVRREMGEAGGDGDEDDEDGVDARRLVAEDRVGLDLDFGLDDADVAAFPRSAIKGENIECVAPLSLLQTSA